MPILITVTVSILVGIGKQILKCSIDDTTAIHMEDIWSYSKWDD